jgi:hypothetical protein
VKVSVLRGSPSLAPISSHTFYGRLLALRAFPPIHCKNLPFFQLDLRTIEIQDEFHSEKHTPSLLYKKQMQLYLDLDKCSSSLHKQNLSLSQINTLPGNKENLLPTIL